jgi:seryl-tRNA synthetase
MENGQQSDGSIAIPDALQSYVGFDSVPGAAK